MHRLAMSRIHKKKMLVGVAEAEAKVEVEDR